MVHTITQRLNQLLQDKPGHTAGQYAVMLDESIAVVRRILSRWEKMERVRKQLEFSDKPYQSYSNQWLYYLNE